MNRLLTILLAVMMVLLSVNLSTAEEASGVKAGDIITFGRYPQTEEGMDQTPIEWIVLEVQGGKALIISRYGLDAVQYNDEHTEVTWETCSLRAWLNRDFLNTAFSLSERDAIPMTEVDNSSAQGYSEWEWNTDGGNNTLDQVFLLSCAEANRYFGVGMNPKHNIKARVESTAYAVSKGAFTTKAYTTENGSAAGWWWLRSPGCSQYFAACVNIDGYLDNSNARDKYGSVRPALWIDLESETFQFKNPQY